MVPKTPNNIIIWHEDRGTDRKQITEGIIFNLYTKDKQANHIVLLAK